MRSIFRWHNIARDALDRSLFAIVTLGRTQHYDLRNQEATRWQNIVIGEN